MLNLSKTVCVLLTLLVVSTSSANSPNERKSLEPYVMREDFQHESLGQWASYPPAQDIGYEPSISPTGKYESPGGRSLIRTVKPNIPGVQRFGFIRKVRMTSGEDSNLKFSYRLNSPATGALEIGLAGTNGQLYKVIRSAKTNEWTPVDLKAVEFQLPSGVGIEAVYLVAIISNADPNVTYQFLIDNIILSALRESSFSFRQPGAELIDPWPQLISTKSYGTGKSIGIEANAPRRMSSVECLLRTQAGEKVATANLFDDGTHGDKVSGDNIWTNSQVHNLSNTDPRGLWIATLQGITRDGESIKSDMRFLVRPEVVSQHPRLFFSASDRDKLMARSQDPKLASLWAYIQTTARSTRESGPISNGGEVFELLDSEYLLPSLLGYFDVLNRARLRISYNSFHGYLTGNAESIQTAKSALLEVSKWKRWEPPWFRAHGQHTYYPAGQLATEVAFAYDLLYTELNETERATIRQALLEKSIIPTYKEYVVDNRAMANTSNWIAHTVGGALIAASSIAGEVTDKDSKFDVYVNGLMRKFEDHMAASFLPDGSYGEGISYHEFDSETLGPAMHAVKRAFGTDYWKQTHVVESLSYALYTFAQPVTASLDMGDTHPPGGHGIAPIVYQSKDPVVRWYYSQFERPSLTKFIFYDDSIQPRAPDLPTSKVFSEKGNAAFRTGWGAGDLVMLFRAGPNFNHHHADQGSFLLSAFGEPLITEAGWSDYYKDPYYATFFTQAVGHNTVLVAGNPESQVIPDTRQFKALNNYPRITDSITSEFYDGVGSELSSVYQGRLSSYTRRIVFVKPNYFVVYDDLKSNKPETFDWLLHLPDRSRVKTDNQTAIYSGTKAALAVRSFSSVNSTLSVHDGRIPYPVFSTRTPVETPAQPAYLDFKTTLAADELRRITAIVPAKTEASVNALISSITELTGDNFTGLRTVQGSSIDLVLFRAVKNTGSIRQGEWLTNSASVVISQLNDHLEMFALQESRSLRRGNQTIFSSEATMSVAARFKLDEAEFVASTSEPTRTTLYVGKSPLRVLIDGREVKSGYSFNRNDGTISLLISTGQHQVRVMFR